MTWSDPFQAQEDAYATSGGADERHGQVHLDGVAIPIQDQVGIVNLATLPQRLTFGDYTLASDNFLSVWVQSDWTGGGQVEDLREASHAQRFRHATADTRYPRILSQPLETLSYTIASAASAIPVGDYAVAGTTYMWFALTDGTARLRRYDASAPGLTGGADLAAMPTGKGVVFDSLLWIPQGASGYDTWDGAAVAHGADATITPVSFAEWDDKLVALEHDGQVSVWNGTAWNADPALKLHGDRVPRGLVVWWTADRFPAVYVVTNRDVWAVDFLVPVLYLTGLHFPVHPDQGLGLAAWRDDAMYVSVGMGVHQLAMGMTISAMGLDRDDGMPPEFRGRIVDLEPEYNSLFALVEGVATTSGAPSSVVVEETMLRDETMVVPTVSSFAKSTLMRWTGLGWQSAWESAGADGTPTRVMVSQAQGEYRLWWGYAGRVYTQVLRRTFHNPRQGAQVGIDRFATASYLRTGRFDANLSTFLKLASHVEVMVDAASRGDITVSYQTDTMTGFKVLGMIPSGLTGRQVLGFGYDTSGFSRGTPFRWIELRYDFVGYDATTTTLVNWASLYFVVRPLQSKSWRGIAQLDKGDEQHQDDGFRQLADLIDGLTTSNQFTAFKHRDTLYRVLCVQTQGADRTGKNLGGGRTFSLVEVNVPLTGPHIAGIGGVE